MHFLNCVSLYINLDLDPSLYLFFTESCLLYLNIRGKSFFQNNLLGSQGIRQLWSESVPHRFSVGLFCPPVLTCETTAHFGHLLSFIHSVSVSVRIIFATTITTTKRGLKICINKKKLTIIGIAKCHYIGCNAGCFATIMIKVTAIIY